MVRVFALNLTGGDSGFCEAWPLGAACLQAEKVSTESQFCKGGAFKSLSMFLLSPKPVR